MLWRGWTKVHWARINTFIVTLKILTNYSKSLRILHFNRKFDSIFSYRRYFIISTSEILQSAQLRCHSFMYKNCVQPTLPWTFLGRKNPPRGKVIMHKIVIIMHGNFTFSCMHNIFILESFMHEVCMLRPFHAWNFSYGWAHITAFANWQPYYPNWFYVQLHH